MSDKTAESSANYILLTRLADEFAARYWAGGRLWCLFDLKNGRTERKLWPKGQETSR
jgi:hypothetical protein